MRLSLALGIACVLGVLLGAALMQRLRALRDSRLARARQQRGARGEQHAELLLRAAGYEILGRQQRRTYRVLQDAGELPVRLAVDFVVMRDGHELVAEVKTGAAASLTHAETRRQLLEYQLASGASRVLLVDPEHERITEVCFPFASATMPVEAARTPDAQDEGAEANGPRSASAMRGVWLFLFVTVSVVLWLVLHAHAHAFHGLR